MFYTVYLLEDQIDKSWYIGYTKNLEKRIENHKLKRVISTKRKKELGVIYCECYINKKDALGREKFLKSGAGRKFLKKQLKNYLSYN
ncbi:GIY-YIG nuclease family protein [Patescibacteria group bacterium]|nr:GIY-YIG nuclease family protein [Patescibacteria group bacterium]MBU0963840.1 GIY-YIG nuclease family protein [Patescibacteria group bacterium]